LKNRIKVVSLFSQNSPEEFIVEEITYQGLVLEVGKKIEGVGDSPTGSSDFTSFVLQKREWNTVQAINEVSRQLNSSYKRFSFAGTKDRNAVTVQLCSAFKLPPEKLLSVKVKDVQINGAWPSSEQVKLGDLLGNRFTITLTKENCGVEGLSSEKMFEKAAGMNFLVPNYFGKQRFGSLRGNSHEVGKLIVQGKLKEACMNFLCFTDEGEKKVATDARKKLGESKLEASDFKEAMNYFPRYLKFERTVIWHLSKIPTDFGGALRKLPRQLQLLFVHAFQSRLFNETLEERMKDQGECSRFELAEGAFVCPANGFGFPHLNSMKTVKKVSKEELNETGKLLEEKKVFELGKVIGWESEVSVEEERILEREGVKKEDFKVKSMPELNARGNFRPFFVPLKDFSATQAEGDGRGINVILKFSLPAGSYATVAVEELLK
jgi:tRNA pseudouridine13 synthase